MLTVGNPFGVGKTATVGIVSARHRDIGAGPFDDFLQLDAPINRGNSGGPSFNLKGQVIGVNTAIYSPSGGNVGIGFAIPSALAKSVISDLMKHGKVERGWLGVQIQAVTDELADNLGLDKAKGALIAMVVDGSPAYKAGLKQGDVILAVNGGAIERLKDLPRVIGHLEAGHRAKLTVWRDGTKLERTVTIGHQPKTQQMAAATHEDGGTVGGLRLAMIDDAARQAYGIGGDVYGVVVTGVQPGSPADNIGFTPGDVILKVGGKKVDAISDVTKAFDTARNDNKKSVLILVQRNGNQHFVALPLGNA